MSGLLGPNGTPYVELGGDRAWRQRTLGDIVISYQWIDLRPWGCLEEQGPEPVMVLFAAARRMEAGAKVIRQRDAHMYATNKGNPSKNLLVSAWDAANTLGFDANDRSVVKRMIDAIVDGIPDLIAMPSDQPDSLEVRKAVQGIEHTVRMAGQVVHQEVR